MKRLKDVTDPVVAFRILAKDKHTRNILHGVYWHTREKKRDFKMKELQRFANQNHDSNCINAPLVHEEKGKEYRWENTDLRLSNLCEVRFIEKVPREGTTIFDYRLSRSVSTLEDFCKYWASSEDDMIQALYSVGFKRILRQTEAIESLGYRPIHHSGSPAQLQELERSSGWLFSPTVVATPGNWEMGLTPPSVKKPTQSSRIVENLGFVFEDLFSCALDETCPKGWAVLICSKNFAREYFEGGWYIPGPDVSRIAELKGRIEKEISTREEVRALLSPLFNQND